MQHEDQQRLKQLINKLGDTIVTIRVRALDNLLSKIENGFVKLVDLSHDEDLLVQLLEWFSKSECPRFMDVLAMLEKFSQIEASARILVSVGGINFLQCLRRDIKEISHKTIDTIVNNLEDVSSKMILEYNAKPIVTEETKEDIQERSPTIVHVVQSRKLSESDEKYLFEMNVKLRHKNYMIVSRTIKHFHDIDLFDFPSDVFVNTHIDIMKSVITLTTVSDEATLDDCQGQYYDELSVSTLAIESVTILLERLHADISKNEQTWTPETNALFPNQPQTMTLLVDTQKVTFMIRTIYSNCTSMLQTKEKIPPILAMFRKTLPFFKNRQVTADEVTIVGGGRSYFDLLYQVLKHHKKELVNDAILVMLLSFCIEFIETITDTNLLQKFIPHELISMLSTLVSNPVLYIANSKLFTRILDVLLRVDPSTVQDYDQAKYAMESIDVLEQLGDGNKDTLYQMDRIRRSLTGLHYVPQHLLMLLEALFQIDDKAFTEDILLKVLTYPLCEIRKETYKYLIDHAILIDRDDLRYAISLECAQGSNDAVKYLLLLITNGDTRLAKYIPILQCAKMTTDALPVLELLDKEMSDRDRILYNARLLFHRLKWIRETASKAIQQQIIQSGAITDVDAFAAMRKDIFDPFEFVIRDLNQNKQVLVSVKIERNLEEFQGGDAENLLNLLQNKQDLKIAISAATQVIELMKDKRFWPLFSRNSFYEFVIDTVNDYTGSNIFTAKILQITGMILKLYPNRREQIVGDTRILYSILQHVYNSDRVVREHAYDVLSYLLFNYSYYTSAIAKCEWIQIDEKLSNIHPMTEMYNLSVPQFVLRHYVLPQDDLFTYQIMIDNTKHPSRKVYKFIREMISAKKCNVDALTSGKNVKLDELVDQNAYVIEQIRNVHHAVVLETLMTELEKAQNHSEFLKSLNKLQNIASYNSPITDTFDQGSSVTIFQRFIIIPPTTAEDDIVLCKILQFLGHVLKRGTVSVIQLRTLSSYLSNLLNILRPTSVNLDRLTLRQSILIFLNQLLIRMVAEDQVQILRDPDIKIVQLLTKYLELHDYQYLRVLAARALCTVNMTMSDEVDSLDSLQGTIQVLDNVLSQEKPDDTFRGIRFYELCALLLCEIASVMYTREQSWIEQLQKITFVSLLKDFPSNETIRASAFHLVDKSLVTIDDLNVLLDKNPKIFEIISQVVMNRADETPLVRQKALSVLCTFSCLFKPTNLELIAQAMHVESKELYLSILEQIEIGNILSLLRTENLTIGFLESFTCLVYDIIAVSTNYRILFEEKVLPAIIQMVSNHIDRLTTVSARLGENLQLYESARNLVNIVFSILESDTTLVYYFIEESSIIQTLLKIMLFTCDQNKDNTLTHAAKESAVLLLNNLIYYYFSHHQTNTDKNILSIMKTDRNMKDLLNASLLNLNQNVPTSLRISVCQLLITAFIYSRSKWRALLDDKYGAKLCKLVIVLYIEAYANNTFYTSDENSVVYHYTIVIGKLLASLFTLSDKAQKAALEDQFLNTVIIRVKDVYALLAIDSLERKTKTEFMKHHVHYLKSNIRVLKSLLMNNQKAKLDAVQKFRIDESLLRQLWYLSLHDVEMRVDVLGVILNLIAKCEFTKKSMCSAGTYTINSEQTVPALVPGKQVIHVPVQRSMIQDMVITTMNPKTNVRVCFLLFRVLSSLVIDCLESRTTLLRLNIVRECYELLSKYYKLKQHHRMDFILKFFIALSMSHDGQIAIAKEKELIKMLLTFMEQKWEKVETLRLVTIVLRNLTLVHKSHFLGTENLFEVLVAAIRRYHQPQYTEIQLYVTCAILSLLLVHPQKYKPLMKRSVAQNELKELTVRLNMLASEQQATNIHDWIAEVKHRYIDKDEKTMEFIRFTLQNVDAILSIVE